MTKFNKASAEISQFEMLVKIYDEIDSLKKTKVAI